MTESKQVWTPGNREKADPETLVEKMLERAIRDRGCADARETYDGWARLSFDTAYAAWHWKAVLRLYAHVGGHPADRHDPDCAYWQPWPPSEDPSEMHPNYEEWAGAQEEDDAQANEAS